MASGKKNYFRHSFYAHNDEFICEMIDKFGLQSYYYWFVLIELCGEQSSSELQETYKFHKRTLCHSLRINTRKLNIYLRYLQDMCKISVTIIENQYEIIFPNLSKYLGKYTTKIEPKSTKKRKEKKRKENIVKSEKFDINLIYDAYPKKQGKVAGIKKLQSLIDNQYLYDKILQASKNYSTWCKKTKREKQYIKQFSTWVNQECWNDVLDLDETFEEKMMNFIGEENV